MEDIQVCSNWEDIADNSSILDQQLEKLGLEKKEKQLTDGKVKILSRNDPSVGVVELDSTREESLRSQYVPPEPRIVLLKRNNERGNHKKSQMQQQPQPVKKTLEQREKEYMEARKRILGDVQFSDDEEQNNHDEDGLSPAEVLKQKVAQVMLGVDPTLPEDGATEEGATPPAEEGSTAPTKKSKGKRREKFKTPNIESPREFPVNKTDSERILRQPRGPDGTGGFTGNNMR